MTTATGYAVVQSGEILVATVSATERAAKVNWLVVIPGVAVSADWSDRRIEDAFGIMRAIFPAEIVAVDIVVAAK